MSTVLLGAASITTTITLSHNVNLFTDDLLRKFGGPTLRLAISSDSKKAFEVLDLDYLRQHPDVMYASPMRVNYAFSLEYEGHKHEGELHMMDDQLFASDPARIISGRMIGAIDESSQNVAISKEMARRLKIPFIDESPVLILGSVGERKVAIRVVGIFAVNETTTYDGGMVLARPTLYSAIEGTSPIRLIVVRARSLEYLDGLEKFYKMYFTERLGSALKVINTRTRVEETKSDFQALLSAGYVLGGLALFSGSIGMMNVMLLNVRLRRKEIGLYRAMGFKSKQIKAQFLAEFVLLAGFGSISGSAIGSVFGVVTSSFILTPYKDFSWLAIILGVVVSLVVGAALGMIPAGRAVQMNAVEALRS